MVPTGPPAWPRDRGRAPRRASGPVRHNRAVDQFQECTLTTSDGVAVSAGHLPSPDGRRELAIVVVHGFTGHWRQDRVRRVIDRLRPYGGIVALDMRGHGRSGGATTVGMDEVHDVEAAVRWARSLGYHRVVTVGFSLGGAVVLREAALMAGGPGRVDAVVAVSAPAFWYYKGTRMTRLAHWMVETRPGRGIMRLRGTRISPAGWPQEHPLAPHEAAGRLGSTPLLIVHGDVDRYFPLEHPHALHRAAREAGTPVDLWVESGFDHAESGVSDGTLDRIGAWVRECPAPDAGSEGA